MPEGASFSPRAAVTFGLFAVLIGGLVIARALHTIPVDASGDAPQWVGVLAGLAFVLAGAAIIVGFAVAGGAAPDGDLPSGTPFAVRLTQYLLGLGIVGLLTVIVATLGLILAWARRADNAGTWGARAALTAGLLALLASPAAWAVTPALAGNAAGVAIVGPDLLARGRGGAGFGPGGAAPEVTRLVDFLREHRRGERYLLATAIAMQAAPIIIRTGDPVMVIGGWSGRDPILTVDRFAALVAAGQVRYVLLPDGLGRDGRVGPNLDARDGLIASRNGDSVAEHGHPVDPALWRPERAEAETDGSAMRPVGPGPRGGGFGPPGFAGRPGWRAAVL
jgi:hypothetical protein